MDAAWTTHHASGAAIVTGEAGSWRCLSAVCASLPEAMQLAAGMPLTLAAVDMPLATTPILARRDCDNQISRAYGKYGCGVHSSTPERPGLVSTGLLADFTSAGFELAVCGSPVRHRQVIEVYPHITVMQLLGESYRVPYKIGRAAQYWPGKTPPQRRRNIRENLARILTALERRFATIPLALPPHTAGPTELKRFEDALDAVVCAWIGTQYLEGKCRGYGDHTAAIWVPA